MPRELACGLVALLLACLIGLSGCSGANDSSGTSDSSTSAASSAVSGSQAASGAQGSSAGDSSSQATSATSTNASSEASDPSAASFVWQVDGSNETIEVEEGASYYDVAHVVCYLELYGGLPGNYITKSEARELGWEGGTPERYLDGAAIGGDTFSNREGLLPSSSGLSYHECDIDTDGASSRGAKRLIYSSDGRYYYSDDHYESFVEYVVEDGVVTEAD